MQIGRINHQNLGFGKLVSLKQDPPSNEPVCQLETDRIVMAEPLSDKKKTRITLDQLDETVISQNSQRKTQHYYKQIELNIPYAYYLKQIEDQTK